MLGKIGGSYKEDMNAAIRRGNIRHGHFRRGSDCHGTRKTHISVDTGCGNFAIPYSGLEGLRKLR